MPQWDCLFLRFSLSAQYTSFDGAGQGWKDRFAYQDILYPFVPAFFMAVTLFMVVFAFMQWPKPSLCSLGSIIAGIPVYHVWSLLRHRGNQNIQSST